MLRISNTDVMLYRRYLVDTYSVYQGVTYNMYHNSRRLVKLPKGDIALTLLCVQNDIEHLATLHLWNAEEFKRFTKTINATIQV